MPSPPLPLPPAFDPRRAAQWSYRPDPRTLLGQAEEWRRLHALRPAGEDRVRVHLLLVDAQKDFCLPEGALYVGGRSGTGAIEDSARIARFIYENLGLITEITCTLDTHVPHQIFFPSFWLDSHGLGLAPHREIAAADVRRGDVRPDPALAAWLADGDYPWLRRQVEFYCGKLERTGKYKLYIWPPHCLLGNDGHSLVGVVEEARLFHAYARGARDGIELKGSNPLTENYSVLSPEVLVRHDGLPLAERNTRLLDLLLGADRLLIAGQASSHCVKSTLEDLLGEIRCRDERLAGRVYILRDCASAVAVPDPASPGKFLADFTPQAEAALRQFAAAGMHLVSSRQPLAEWPDIRL